jgi:hypothetical protein
MKHRITDPETLCALNDTLREGVARYLEQFQGKINEHYLANEEERTARPGRSR